jgi:aspartate kinase
MLVLKFGGTSVRNAEWLDRTLQIARDALPGAPLLVSSAMAGVTDSLQGLARRVEAGEGGAAWQLQEALKERHLVTATRCLTGANLARCLATLDDSFQELAALCGALAILKDCPARSNDAILSFGELWSTTLLYHRALELGLDATWLDARRLVVTDENFGSAAVLWDETSAAIREAVQPRPGHLLITQGFLGATRKGVTSTLGRGGSDYSATIFGAALGASEVQIWTDVPGIVTCDPRLVDQGRTLEELSYREAAELAYFGAKVIHPATIAPALARGIPVLVLNTADPHGPHTRITQQTPSPGLKAIACKKGLALVHIDSSGMLLAHGFLRRIFEVFERHATAVDLVSTSEVSVSMTVDRLQHLDEIARDLGQLGSVRVETNQAIVSLVGQDLWTEPALLPRTFQALHPAPLRMVSLGASDINLSLVLGEDACEDAVRRLHQEFFGGTHAAP